MMTDNGLDLYEQVLRDRGYSEEQLELIFEETKFDLGDFDEDGSLTVRMNGEVAEIIVDFNELVLALEAAQT